MPNVLPACATFATAMLALSAAGQTPDAASAQARPAETVVSGPLAERADEYLSRCVPFGFSGSVILAVDGAVILD